MPNTISSFYSFSPNTKARASEINTNFNNFRGALLPINTDTLTTADSTFDLGNSSYYWKDLYISGNINVGSIPSYPVEAGTVFEASYNSAPSNCLLCDGSSVSRTTYSNLFSAITNGTNTSPAFGYETSTNFNLPDIRGKFVRGVDSGAGNDPDASSRTAQGTNGFTGDTLGSIQDYATGEADSTITTSSNGSHTHGVSTYQSVNAYLFQRSAFVNTFNYSTTNNGDHSHTISGANESRPINLYLNHYIIY